MKTEFLSKLEQASELELLYHSRKAEFIEAFEDLYPSHNHLPIFQFWHARLYPVKSNLLYGLRKDAGFLLIGILMLGVFSFIPQVFNLSSELYFQKHLSFMLFGVLMVYFGRKSSIQNSVKVALAGIFAGLLLYINLLPSITHQDVFLLVCLHLPLLLWLVLGFTYVGGKVENSPKRWDFLRFNADLLVMSVLIFLSSVIFAGLSAALFSFIGLNLESIITEHVVVWGLLSIPLLAAVIITHQQQLVGTIAPLIARLFTPLAVLLLTFYVISALSLGKNPFQDREFLLVFNLILIAVLALIIFSLQEVHSTQGNKLQLSMILSLALISLLINGIALSAIVYRISEWGLSPNRLAVLGANLFILTHLVQISRLLIKNLSNKADLKTLKLDITAYLPMYGVWALIVLIVFPLYFNP